MVDIKTDGINALQIIKYVLNAETGHFANV